MVNIPLLGGDVPRSPSCEIYISQLICLASVRSNLSDFYMKKKLLTAKLLKQGYRYYKTRKYFLNSTTDTQS